MTMLQIKKSLGKMPEEERLYLLHHLRHLVRADTEANRRDLSRRHDEIAAGRKVTLAQVKRLDAAFRSEGL